MEAGDRLVRSVLGGGSARILWVDATATVRAMCDAHSLEQGSAELAGELALANLLMSAWVKGDERVSLQLQAEQPRVSFVGEADSCGHFRGRFSPPGARAKVTGLEGLMLAIKSDASRELYRGITKIDGESVAVALEGHLSTSDQVLAVVRLSVTRSEQGEIAAYGVVLEGLPGVSTEDFALLTEVVDGVGLSAIGAMIDAGRLMVYTATATESVPLSWSCRCSRERVEGMLSSLGRDELRAMLEEDGGAEVVCHYCGEVYRFDEAALALVMPVASDARA